MKYFYKPGTHKTHFAGHFPVSLPSAAARRVSTTAASVAPFCTTKCKSIFESDSPNTRGRLSLERRANNERGEAEGQRQKRQKKREIKGSFSFHSFAEACQIDGQKQKPGRSPKIPASPYEFVVVSWRGSRIDGQNPEIP